MAATSGRVIAIGDVHGCIHALDALVEAIGPGRDDTLVLLGDMIDQGRNSCEVLDRVIELRSQCRVIPIAGNHEEMMLAARNSEQALNFWMNCGGALTLSSYNFPGHLADVPDKHWQLIEQCLPFYETDDFIFTHANYLPDVPMPLQPGHQLRWALFDPAEMHPHFSGKPVTVGHTEQRDAEILDLGFAMCIDTVCWQYGWLTAIDRTSGQIWQVSRWGVLREPGELHDRERLSQLLGVSGGPA